tara:strand:- start:122 stop:1672 length:1551 start_codon:yes stop_codon:yes gene_type:complete
MARTGTDKTKRRTRATVDQETLGSLNLDFSQSPTTWKFLGDDSFFRGLMGPVGSGKSYACAAEILLRAAKQPPSPKDNIRYSRYVVVRNSYPELRTTTLKTWTELFPENQWGPLRWSPPITHHIKLPPRPDVPGLDCEVIFLALDQPKDVRKLLSLELTGAWVNEARELPLAVVQGLTHRVGRYPTKSNGGAPWRGIWADTNPMDDDHWWHRLAEKEPVKGKYKWNFFRQPPGMIEAKIDAPEAQPAAGRHWVVNSKAENINNLPDGYYNQQLGGKDLDWIQCYVGGQYVYVKEGRSVWHEYDDVTMSVEGLTIDDTLPIQIGLDFGLTPAAVFGQRLPNGLWRILHELVTEDMGLERFGQMLLYELNTRFKGLDPMIWGDPAGMKRDEIFEVTSFDHLRTLGLQAQPTNSNDFMVRREAGAGPMTRIVAGGPALQVDALCRRTRKALAGGYHFKRVGISGGMDRFRDVPNKDQNSHVGDAFGYLMLGGGEHRRLTRSPTQHSMKPITAAMDFKVL